MNFQARGLAQCNLRQTQIAQGGAFSLAELKALDRPKAGAESQEIRQAPAAQNSHPNSGTEIWRVLPTLEA